MEGATTEKRSELLLSRETKKKKSEQKKRKSNENSLLWPLWLISRKETAGYIRAEVHTQCFLGFFSKGDCSQRLLEQKKKKKVWYPDVLFLHNRKVSNKVLKKNPDVLTKNKSLALYNKIQR